jgi:AraC family transcriptional regulator
MAELRDAVQDPASMVFGATAWNEVQLVAMRFPTKGSVVVPPIGFYSISSHTGTRSFLCEDRGSRARPAQVPPGATLVHEKGAGARYAWAAAHSARMVCLDAQVVARAAEETGWVKPARLHVPSAFDRRDEVLESLVAVLATEAELGPHAVRDLMVESVATGLACRLLERVTMPESGQLSQPGALSNEAFERVRAFVEDNLGRSVSLTDLAQVAGVSRFHFARQFRKRTGESPLGYVRRVRIERAKLLLRSSRPRIVDVALALGFADQSHFTRTFHAAVGLTPRSFARSHGRAISVPSGGRPGGRRRAGG